MSKYQDCVLFVDANGRYCCSPKSFNIGEDCACGYSISLANVPAVDLQIQVADEWVTFQTLTDPATNIITAGCFRIDPAFCEALDCTDAPEEGAMSICCEELDCAALDYLAICEKLETLTMGEMGPIEVDFTEVIEKLCAALGPNAEGETTIDKLCDILNAIIADASASLTFQAAALACLETLKATAEADATADADFYAAALDCFTAIKANTAAITGIETALGQVGCIFDEEGGPIGTVLVCKVTDTTTTPPSDTIKVWAFLSDGSVVEDYTGPYEPCTNLSALLACLEDIKDNTAAITDLVEECCDCTIEGSWSLSNLAGAALNDLTVDGQSILAALGYNPGATWFGTKPSGGVAYIFSDIANWINANGGDATSFVSGRDTFNLTAEGFCGPDLVFDWATAPAGEMPVVTCPDESKSGMLVIVKNAKDFEDECAGNCPDRVVYDVVCNDAEQTVNGVTVPAFEPIIRQRVTPQAFVDCECVDSGATESRFFDFLDPSVAFTDTVAFTGPCDPQTQVTKERCDANGVKVTVVEISTSGTGADSVVTFYDDNGDVVVPAFPLSVCNPRVQILCGCIRNADGSIAIRDVQQHNLFDDLGTSDANYYLNGAVLNVGKGQYFTCDCNELKDDVVPSLKYTYDLSTFAVPCDDSTITVDEEEVDLCGDDTAAAVIPSAGDICTVGGVRSDFDPDRCYTDPQTDPADYAAELLANGSFGDKTVNPLAAQATANFGMAIRGTFPSLEGTTAPMVMFGATWNVGSGIAIAAYDCATGNDLDIIGGTAAISTYDAVGGPGCQVPSSRGLTDSWGGVGLGPATIGFDTSAVADLSTVVFYSIVLNPGTSATNADWLSDVTVQGVSPTGVACDIQTLADLEAALTSLLPDCTVELTDTTLCITCASEQLGALTCDAVSIDPTVLDQSRNIQVPYVALSPCSVSALAGDDSAVTELLNEIAELQGENLVKNCFIEDALLNCACPVPVIGLDKTALTLTLMGDVVEQYETAGTPVALQDVNGNICGSATVGPATDPAPYATYDAVNDVTVISLEECELQEGKAAAQIKTAKAVKQSVKLAVATQVKQISIREVKKLAAKAAVKTRTKTETKKV